jgi:hypothetical protein
MKFSQAYRRAERLFFSAFLFAATSVRAKQSNRPQFFLHLIHAEPIWVAASA